MALGPISALIAYFSEKNDPLTLVAAARARKPHMGVWGYTPPGPNWARMTVLGYSQYSMYTDFVTQLCRLTLMSDIFNTKIIKNT